VGLIFTVAPLRISSIRRSVRSSVTARRSIVHLSDANGTRSAAGTCACGGGGGGAGSGSNLLERRGLVSGAARRTADATDAGNIFATSLLYHLFESVHK
jgi:hypothetical protein